MACSVSVQYCAVIFGPLALPRTPILISVTVSAAIWLFFTWFSGGLSDKIGRRQTYIYGFIVQLFGVVALFPLVNIGEIWSVALGLCFLAVGIGMTYGAQSAFYSELFPASIRFSGVSISYALGAILGGAFSPLIASWLVSTTGSTDSVGFYLVGMTLIGLVATILLKDRSGIPLGPDHEALQSESAFTFSKEKTKRVYSD